MTDNPFDALADRIRDEAAQASRSGQMARLEAIADEVDRLRQGAKTLGKVVESDCRAVLDITGRHDLIGEDGDGDWGAVWEHLYELPAKAWDEGMAAFSRGEGSDANPYLRPTPASRSNETTLADNAETDRPEEQ